MFGWFGAKPPVDLREKVWIERRLAWLVDQFGAEPLRQAPAVLPTYQYFAIDYEPSEDCVWEVLGLVCGYLNLPPARFQLEFEAVPSGGSAWGSQIHEDHTVLTFYADRALDLEQLIAALSHQVCRDLLRRLPDGRGDTPDLELRADLLAVMLGMGVFGANVAVQRSGRVDAWEFWEVTRLAHLPARMSGYAMALIAWLRGETSPPKWTSCLTADAASPLKSGLKYLIRTGDSVLRPENLGRPAQPYSPAAFADALGSESDTMRLAALQALRDQPADAAASRGRIEENLQHRNSILVAEAAETVAATRAAVDLQLLCRGLLDSEPDVRTGSARALAAIAAPLQERGLQSLLEQQLADAERAPALAAAEALALHAAAAQDSAPFLVKRLLAETRSCEYEAMNQLLDCLARIVGHVPDYLDQHHADCDPELRRLIDNALLEEEEEE